MSNIKILRMEGDDGHTISTYVILLNWILKKREISHYVYFTAFF